MNKEDVYRKAIAIIKDYMAYLDSMCEGYPFDIITNEISLKKNLIYNDYNKGYFKYDSSEGVSLNYFESGRITSTWLRVNGKIYSLEYMGDESECVFKFITGVALWITENKEVIPNIINNRKNQLNDLMNYESAFSNIKK